MLAVPSKYSDLEIFGQVILLASKCRSPVEHRACDRERSDKIDIKYRRHEKEDSE
jgi:hypothetical protein